MFVVHRNTLFPYNEDSVILGYVSSLEEFDTYAKKTFGVTNETYVELDTFGRGSMVYEFGFNNQYTNLVCEPISKLV
jgi:hypothetical protein